MADRKQDELRKQGGLRRLYNAPWVTPAALVALALVIAGSGFWFYRLRQQAVQAPQAPPPTMPNVGAEHVIKEPTGELEAAMDVFVNENELAMALQLVDVNLAANTRRIIWFYTDSPGLQQVIDNFERTKPGTTPWMTPDPVNNTRQLSVMNGNAECEEIVKTRLATTIIGVTDYVSYFCVIAVPPEHGRFSGYLAIWMPRIPSADEQSRLIERLRTLSAQIAAAQ